MRHVRAFVLLWVALSAVTTLPALAYRLSAAQARKTKADEVGTWAATRSVPACDAEAEADAEPALPPEMVAALPR